MAKMQGTTRKTRVRVTFLKDGKEHVEEQEDIWQVAHPRDINQKAILAIVLPQILSRPSVTSRKLRREHVKSTTFRAF